MDDLPTEDVEVDASAIAEPIPEEIDNKDGTTTILLDGNAPPTSSSWFENLAETLPEAELDELARKYLELIDQDIEAREERDKMQAEGLKKAGLGGPAPGGAEFEGASKVTHPVLMQAYIDFAASSIKELFPPDGPVRAKVEGKPNKEKMDRATRKTEFLNWQLTEQMRSYRPELERLLTQVPVGGSQYMKLYWDEGKLRPNVEFIPIDDMVLPYEARNFFDVQRKFHKMNVSDFEYERRVLSGAYRDLSLPTSYQNQEKETESARQTARIEGKRNDYSSITGERLIFEGCVYDTIYSDIKAPEDKACPYLITIDEESRKILSLYRNWDEDNKTQDELEYIVDFNFIPWRGVFSLSLLQCLAGLPDALTGALRAILDSALISNMQGGLKLRGNPGGASLSISPTQVTEVDSMGQDDIRKIYMPIPFNPPSPILFQLLGLLTEWAQQVVGSAEEKIAEASNQMPVGTALALIEQGAKVFSSIHARLHDSQRRCLEILHRLNRDHLPDDMQYGSDPEDHIGRADFEGSMDVHPVSDPNIFSETQRFAQIQFVMQSYNQGVAVNPAVAQIFDLRKLYARAFEMAKIPDYEDFLPPAPEATPLNPVDENVSLVMGKPVKAFTGQNHEAHIQVLLDFAQNPLFGKSPAIAQKFIPGAINHLQDHLLVWYEEMMKADAAQSMGKNPAQVDWDDSPDSSVAMAKSCAVVDKASQLAFAKIPQLIAQAMQQLQAMAPKPPVDPMVQVAQADVQGKQQIAQQQLSLNQQKVQADAQAKIAEIQAKLTQAQQDYHLAMQKMGVDAQTTLQTAELQSQTDLAKTIHDNASAQHIAAMKIAADGGTRLSDGASLNKGE
jgi:hypothetical protein